MIENEDDRLLNMLLTQLTFQKKLLQKRHTISPDDVMTSTSAKLAEACYHAACTNVELAEFIDQLHQDKCNRTDEVVLELTDAFTFLLNQLLYINIIPTRTLGAYYAEAEKMYNATRGIKFHEIIGQYNVSIGKLYHKTRYKTWKTYTELDDNVYALIPLVDEVLITFLQLYVKLGVSADDLCTYFYKKHEINEQRQEVGGKYETV